MLTSITRRRAIGALLAMPAAIVPCRLSAGPAPSLTIVSEVFPPHSTADARGFEDLLAKEMFRRIGVAVEIEHLPSERVLLHANQGDKDGAHSRIAGMSEKFPNLVQLRESTMQRDYVAFARGADIEISDWDSLAPYHVGIVNGWKILEWNIKQAKSLTKVRTARQLFQLLDAGRVDIVVYGRWVGLHVIRELGLQGLRDIDPPLATREVFAYLHRKHQDLVPRVSTALGEMKRDGAYQRIFEQTLGHLVAD